MDFDRVCKVSCYQGYINFNNTGNCVRCEPQCNGCTILLHNCSECAAGFVSSISLVNGT
jgi:hypothetical protein